MGHVDSHITSCPLQGLSFTLSARWVTFLGAFGHLPPSGDSVPRNCGLLLLLESDSHRVAHPQQAQHLAHHDHYIAHLHQIGVCHAFMTVATGLCVSISVAQKSSGADDMLGQGCGALGAVGAEMASQPAYEDQQCMWLQWVWHMK